jgi:hypothetical protein
MGAMLAAGLPRAGPPGRAVGGDEVSGARHVGVFRLGIKSAGTTSWPLSFIVAPGKA